MHIFYSINIYTLKTLYLTYLQNFFEIIIFLATIKLFVCNTKQNTIDSYPY